MIGGSAFSVKVLRRSAFSVQRSAFYALGLFFGDERLYDVNMKGTRMPRVLRSADFR